MSHPGGDSQNLVSRLAAYSDTRAGSTSTSVHASPSARPGASVCPSGSGPIAETCVGSYEYVLSFYVIAVVSHRGLFYLGLWVYAAAHMDGSLHTCSSNPLSGIIVLGMQCVIDIGHVRLLVSNR